MAKRFTPLALSTLFLLISLALHQSALERFTPAGEAQSPEGVWHQYAECDGQSYYLGTFRFTERGGDFDIELLDISPHAYPQNELRTFGHRFDGESWTFYSDWKIHGVAHFELKRRADGHFVGTARVDDRDPLPYLHHLVRAE